IGSRPTTTVVFWSITISEGSSERNTAGLLLEIRRSQGRTEFLRSTSDCPKREMAHSPAWPSEPQQAVRTSAGGPEKSRCLSFCRDLVRSIPGIFNFHGRSHPTLVAAATGKTLELSRTAGKFPGALDGDLSAGSGDPAFKSAEVAVAVRMLVDEVAALRTIASDQVGRAPVGDFGVVPLLIR